MNATQRIDVDYPDMTLVGGKIVTVDQRGSIAEAIAIRDGRISAIGSSAEIRLLAGPRTRTVNLDGRTVIPGLIDSHLHALRDGRTFVVRLDWSRVFTLKQALDTIRTARRKTSPGSWIVAIEGGTLINYMTAPIREVLACPAVHLGGIQGGSLRQPRRNAAVIFAKKSQPRA
jgi:predicted amidohydrolase YtcJ